MASRPQTKSGTRKLSDVARKVVAPERIASTGWPSVQATCEKKLGITFDDWQHGAGRLILAKRADGRLASTIDGVGMCLPRQVGKTYLIGAMIFALCVEMPGLLVIWSAHHARTHGETFIAMQGFADRARVKAYVSQVYLGSGDEEIRFHNGSRILFGARERGFGRGIPGVDVLVFDEAQILSDRALANMLATLNTSQFGLHLYVGTPPRTEDNSESFRRTRADAYEGRLKDGAWIEFGADPGSKPDDRKQWAKANPSYPRRTPAESITRLQRKLTPEDFLREGMGIWDDMGSRPLIMPTWPLCKTTQPPGKPVALGVAMDPDRVWLSCGACSVDDVPHLGPVTSAQTGRTLRVRASDPTFGKAQFVAEVARIAQEQNVAVVLDRKGPASDLEDDLTAAGATVVGAGLDDAITAAADLYDAVEAKEVTHGGYEDLDAAVAAADWRKSGDRRLFARRNGDVSMLEAVMWAFWGAENAAASVYNDRDMVVL